jgi:AAA family ATP:ADP antiporter
VLLSAAYFFLLLMAYYLLRPLRETFGISRGADKLPIIWSCTLGAMALINPIYSALLSRWPRRLFIPAAYHAFAGMLLVFGMLYQLLPDHGGAALGYTFYVWLSVFNLFVVSIFWSFMADMFNRDDGQRLFGVIAMGGTLGAMAGSSAAYAAYHLAWLLGAVAGSASMVKIIGWLASDPARWLFFLSAFVLELAVLCIWALLSAGRTGDGGLADSSREPGPSAAAGFALLGKSILLRAISIYILLYALTGTFLYVYQGYLVERLFETNAARAAAFAKIDFWANALTLTTQLFFTHRLVARAGLPIALAILPIVTLIGFGALWAWPAFISLALFQVARRGLH